MDFICKGPAQVLERRGVVNYKIEFDDDQEKNQSYQHAEEVYQYRFEVMQFRLKNSGATFDVLLRQVLNGARDMQSLAEDVNASNGNFEDHARTLKDFFERVRKANLRIKPSKTKIGCFEVQFLGQVVSQRTVEPTDGNVQRIVTASASRTKQGVRL